MSVSTRAVAISRTTGHHRDHSTRDWVQPCPQGTLYDKVFDHGCAICQSLKLFIRARVRRNLGVAHVCICDLGHLVLPGPGTWGSIRAVALVGDDLARGDVLAEHATLEDLVDGLGLVGGDGVAGIKDAGEGHVAVLADQAAIVRRVSDDVGVAGGAEGRGGRVVDGERDVLDTDP